MRARKGGEFTVLDNEVRIELPTRRFRVDKCSVATNGQGSCLRSCVVVTGLAIGGSSFAPCSG